LMDTERTRKFRKRLLICAIVVAIVFLALYWVSHYPEINRWLIGTLRLFRPVLIGLVAAYLLNPIFRFFERKLFQAIRPFGLRRTLALLCSFLVMFIVLGCLLLLILPQLIESITDFAKNYNQYLSTAIHHVNVMFEKINQLIFRLTGIESSFGQFDEKTITDALFGEENEKSVLQYLSEINYKPITAKISDAISGLMDFLIGMFITIYLLASKEKRYAQIMKLRHALFGDAVNAKITNFCTIANDSFGNFIRGKLIDSLIVGILIYVPLEILNVPYAILLAAFIAVLNILPMVGILIGTIPTALIVLLSDPGKILPFLLVVIIVHQIDTNIISPKILGSNTGVSSLCVLIAITLMGSLWGIFGLLLAVPLFATVLALLEEWTVSRLQRKGLPSGVDSYYATDVTVSPEENITATTDRIVQRIERTALRAQNKQNAGEKLTKKERFVLRLHTFARRHHIFTDISERAIAAVATEEILKTAQTDAEQAVRTRRASRDARSNTAESTSDSDTIH